MMPKLFYPFVLLSLLIAVFASAETDPEDTNDNNRPTTPFDREWLINKAKALAQTEFNPTVIEEGNPFSSLDYDQYRAIRFQRGAAIWQREDRNFRVGLMPPGFLFKTPVNINLVVGNTARRVLYSAEIFDYDLDTAKVKDAPAPGYSGFRVQTPINNPDIWDEFLVFQGGSYFRAVGKHNWYGLSARGLAINTAQPDGEEFPLFSEFWIERPKPGAQQLIIHALLESQSLTGAYTFTATPGHHTVIEVDGVLFPRKDIEHFGIAPLTSMFLFDEKNQTKFDDIRPAVHDSDGLYIALKNGENIWRPLANPNGLQVSSFSSTSPVGFGLMQRSREFTEFEDIEAKYQDRPSAWVEPLNDWGEGHVELVEIPTKLEIHDNIVAFWQPKQTLKAGEAFPIAYRIYWGDQAPHQVTQGRIVNTRSGISLNENTLREFVIDYAADDFPTDLAISLESSAGSVKDVRGVKVDATGHYRVFFKFDPAGNNLSEFRLSLASNGKPWGETWLYRWTR